MNTNLTPRFTSQALAEQITKYIEELAQATDEARMSNEMLRYLETCAKFHQYSFNNIWLILMQCPHATQVAGFRKWQSMNRYVRKGEHGIPILAPIIVSNDDVSNLEKTVVGFKVVYVFDISQTDGEPLPEPPDWKSPEKNEELSERLKMFAEEHDIIVTEKALAGETQGVSKGGAIEIDPLAGTKTLIHEIAHELMHRGTDVLLDRGIKELEAEAVAFVVGKHFGLEATGSPNHVALHGADSAMILAHMEKIQSNAIQFISALVSPA